MKTFFLFLIPLSLAFAYPAVAQVEEEDELAVNKDTVIQIDDNRFIYRSKIYKKNTPYVTLGYGAGMNLGKKTIEQNMTISYHYFIKGLGVGLGYHTSKDDKVWWRSHQTLIDYHLLVGKRWDGVKYNIAGFVGPSFAKGEYITYVEEVEEDRYFPFSTFGFEAELQYTYRLLYDVGIGISAYTSLNKYTQVVGAQLHLFFSTAYVRSYN